VTDTGIRDWEQVVQFQEFLKRAPVPNTITPWFDGDVHLVAGDIADRAQFTITDGKIEATQ
jgi:hypothetical protein